MDNNDLLLKYLDAFKLEIKQDIQRLTDSLGNHQTDTQRELESIRSEQAIDRIKIKHLEDTLVKIEKTKPNMVAIFVESLVSWSAPILTVVVFNLLTNGAIVTAIKQAFGM